MNDHAGRVALITGGSSGIGRGAAIELARQGAAVAVHGLVLEEAEQVVDIIRQDGGRALAVTGPINDPATSENAVRATIGAFGRLDTLVTSAGIQRYGDVVATPESTWDEVFDINVKGVFLACKFALPYIRKSPAGSIVVIASVQASASQPQVAAYTASKGALVALARAMAVDEGGRGVRVNSVSPGSVDTPMLQAAAALFSDGSQQGIDNVVGNWGTAHPLGRVATIEEVGAVISFIASPLASFVTGDDIRVDGGLLALLPAPIPIKKEGS